MTAQPFPAARVVARTTGALGALALALAGCSGSSTGASARATHEPMASHSATVASAGHPFGSDCGMVPASGSGSFHAMSMDPVLVAAQANPLLTTFAADVRSAGLAGELNAMTGVTVFAPDNTAFTKLPAADQTAMMHNPAELKRILTYHVVDGRISPAQLASGTKLTTLEGSMVSPSRMGAVYEVNSADVLCGNIATANATVYIINKVLIPTH